VPNFGLVYLLLSHPLQYVIQYYYSRTMRCALSLEICARIALHTQPTTLRVLTSLSRSTLKALRPLLYGRIVVADSGQTLVQSLASNKELPPMVRERVFHQQ
jgi:hypothetical protein